MTKYVAQIRGQKVSKASLGGIEYGEDGGYIEVPETHHQAHAEAALLGLEKDTGVHEIRTESAEKSDGGEAANGKRGAK